MNPPTAPDLARLPVQSWRVDPAAVLALFRMTVARLVRGKRLVLLSALFALPILLALLGQRYDDRYEPEVVERVLILALIPQTLVPLTALVFAAGMIQDEVEEQTLTYLLIRPLPRPAIYLTKLAGTLVVTGLLSTAFTFLSYAVIYEFQADDPWRVFLERPLKTSAATLLALAAYGSLFGLIGVYRRQALVIGVIYIVGAEGVLANIDFLIRKATVMYQFRVITIRWMELSPFDWQIRLDDAPSLTWAMLNLAIAAVVLGTLGAVLFARREYRLKTPEAT